MVVKNAAAASALKPYTMFHAMDAREIAIAAAQARAKIAPRITLFVMKIAHTVNLARLLLLKMKQKLKNITAPGVVQKACPAAFHIVRSGTGQINL